MIPKPIDQITAADIQSLIDNGVSERRTLDYKQALPGNSDGERKEFLADVTSFANASGGDLCFGITETGGAPQGIVGLAGMDADAERLRLESMIRDGVAPRLLGVQLEVIDGFPSGPVLIRSKVDEASSAAVMRLNGSTSATAIRSSWARASARTALIGLSASLASNCSPRERASSWLRAVCCGAASASCIGSLLPPLLPSGQQPHRERVSKLIPWGS